MALRGQFLIFCVLVLLVFESRSAYGSSRGWLGRAGDATAAQEIGICASSVIIHGYKCQEIDVRAHRSQMYSFIIQLTDWIFVYENDFN